MVPVGRNISPHPMPPTIPYSMNIVARLGDRALELNVRGITSVSCHTLTTFMGAYLIVSVSVFVGHTLLQPL